MILTLYPKYEMSTYLLNWNPRKWDWFDIEDDIFQLADDGWLVSRWSCGVTKKIQPGDRFFLMRLGIVPKGIIGSGWIVSEPFNELHWDDQLAELGRHARYVDIVFDALLNAEVEDILDLQFLQNDPVLSEMNWLQQSSGVRIPDLVADRLAAIWSEFLTVSYSPASIDALDNDRFLEGSIRESKLTYYERNTAARKYCLEHYGYKCVICGFDFVSFYGKVAESIIHVHHLIPLSDIGGEYELDPIKDLRPVCPNCHAVIHRRKPAYSIEDVQGLIRERKSVVASSFS